MEIKIPIDNSINITEDDFEVTNADDFCFKVTNPEDEDIREELQFLPGIKEFTQELKGESLTFGDY